MNNPEAESVRVERCQKADRWVRDCGDHITAKDDLQQLAQKWSAEAVNAPDPKRRKFAESMMWRLSQIGAALRAGKPELAVYLATFNSDLSSINVNYYSDGKWEMPAAMQEEMKKMGAVIVPGKSGKVIMDNSCLLPTEGRIGRSQRLGGLRGVEETLKSKPAYGQPENIRKVFETFLKKYPLDRALAISETADECEVSKRTVTRALEGSNLSAPKGRRRIK